MNLDNYGEPAVLVTCRSRLNLIRTIRERISNTPREALFKETCFGWFLDLDDWPKNCIIIHFMLGRQVKCLGGETDIVHLSYHIVDNFEIQFGMEEFCLVTGLRFGVEYSANYNNEDDLIPFRRRVFSSAIMFVLLGLEDKRKVLDWILRLANDRGDWDMDVYLLEDLHQMGLKLDRTGRFRVGHFLMVILVKQHEYRDMQVGLMRQAKKGPIIVSQHYGLSDLSGFRNMQRFSQGGPSSFPTQPSPSYIEAKSLSATPNWQTFIPSHPHDAGLLNPPGTTQQEGWLSGDEKPQYARWTMSKSGTICVHPETKRFMIPTDQHIIGTLDGSTHPYLAWNDVDWVYKPHGCGSTSTTTLRCFLNSL
nr:phospholipase-like protein [Tanacetum cinerariifolium]